MCRSFPPGTPSPDEAASSQLDGPGKYKKQKPTIYRTGMCFLVVLQCGTAFHKKFLTVLGARVTKDSAAKDRGVFSCDREGFIPNFKGGGVL
jgi:hypothetical protein